MKAGTGSGPFIHPEPGLGGFELNLTGCHAVIVDPLPGMPIEGMLPGHVLRNHDVVFDYPNYTFTISGPGTPKAEGLRLAAPVAAESGFPRVELEVDGEKLGFLLDTGAAFTMVSKTWFDHIRRPDEEACYVA